MSDVHDAQWYFGQWLQLKEKTAYVASGLGEIEIGVAALIAKNRALTDENASLKAEVAIFRRIFTPLEIVNANIRDAARTVRKALKP